MYECIKVCWKNTITYKVTKNVLKALCQKSILYVFQNVRWNERKCAPILIQNAHPCFFFLPKMYHYNMISPLYFNPKKNAKTRSQHTCQSCLHFFIELSWSFHVALGTSNIWSMKSFNKALNKKCENLFFLPQSCLLKNMVCVH